MKKDDQNFEVRMLQLYYIFLGFVTIIDTDLRSVSFVSAPMFFPPYLLARVLVLRRYQNYTSGGGLKVSLSSFFYETLWKHFRTFRKKPKLALQDRTATRWLLYDVKKVIPLVDFPGFLYHHEKA